MDYPNEPKVVIRVRIKESRKYESQKSCGDRKKGQSQKFENAVLLALKMEKGTMNQEMPVASKNWKRQGKRISPTVFRKNYPW